MGDTLYHILYLDGYNSCHLVVYQAQQPKGTHCLLAELIARLSYVNAVHEISGGLLSLKSPLETASFP